MIPLDWTTKYLETIVVELNYLKVEVFNVLVFDSSFGPDVQEIWWFDSIEGFLTFGIR